MVRNFFYKLGVLVLLVSIVGLVIYDKKTNTTNVKEPTSNVSTTTTDTDDDNTSSSTELSSTTVHCIGDSFTVGSGSYVNYLASDAKVNVDTLGGANSTSTDNAIEANAMPIYTKAFTIPSTVAETPIKLYFANGISADETLLSSDNAFKSVTIAGVAGTLAYDSVKKVHTFARDTAGEAVKVTAATQLKGKELKWDADDIYVFFTGQHDPYFQNSIFRTTNAIDTIVKKHNIKKYVVVSLTSHRRYIIVDAMNKVLSNKFGTHYLGFRSYLMNSGLKDADITATAQDKKDMAVGNLPTSLLNSDLYSGNSSFNKLLSKQLTKKMKALGYLK